MTQSWNAVLPRLKTVTATAAALNEALAVGDDRDYVIDLSLNLCRDLEAVVKAVEGA